jgi:UDP-N-acetylmuramoylalanine--D-glutamate ligase
MANHPKIAILGGAESGVGAARLAVLHGYEVFLSDRGQLKPTYREALTAAGVEFEEGQHTMERILAAEAVIKSPGIPNTAPAVVAIRDAGIQIISEIEFAYYYCKGQIIGVTGTNGKTTTVTLIHKLLKDAGLKVGLCGNVGNSFAGMLVDEPAHDWYVVEISSFQLDDVHRFRPHIAIITNIAENHLDRYDHDMSLYAAAKFNITRNQTEDDFFIYCQDSPVLMRELPRHPTLAQHCPYGFQRLSDTVSWITNLTIQVDMTNNKTLRKKLAPQAHTIETKALMSKHNQHNAMAASVVAQLLEIRKESVRQSFAEFQNVEHRLEAVRTLDGVSYINDSKATNVNSVWYALESQNQPAIWIMGGVDKGNDYGMLRELVGRKVKAIIILGTQNESKIREAFSATGKPILQADNMDLAVSTAHSLAETNEVVLLSPACASFDLYENYEARGRAFKDAVNGLSGVGLA